MELEKYKYFIFGWDFTEREIKRKQTKRFMFKYLTYFGYLSCSICSLYFLFYNIPKIRAKVVVLLLTEGKKDGRVHRGMTEIKKGSREMEASGPGWSVDRSR